MRGKTKSGLKIRDFLVDFLKSNFTHSERTIFKNNVTPFSIFLKQKVPITHDLMKEKIPIQF
jgi:hypothetical protein